ncbi:MAG: hypothetical protein LAP21_03750 [Acidobacteriia bacterium]|nr:hypothetical protein [Terriglobia bacterium]
MIVLWVISPEAGRTLFFVAVVVVVGWFAVGTILNVRKGNAVARWLQEGLPLIGQKTTLRWLGSSAVELKIQDARNPLLHVEIFILMEPRDVPFLWGYFHARGRRDILIARCRVSSAPVFQLEAGNPRAWTTRGAQKEAIRKQWVPVPSPQGVNVVAYGEGRLETAPELLTLAAGCQLPLVRLAIRRAEPEIEVQWQLLRFGNVSARRVFELLLQISNQL